MRARTSSRNIIEHVEMVAVAESSDGENPNSSRPTDFVIRSETLENVARWIEYSVQQAMIYQKTLEESIDSATQTFRSRLSQIRLTASAHFHQTIVNF